MMDILEYKDWYTFHREPAPLIERRLELLAMRGEFERKQAERISKGQPSRVTNVPLEGIERSD